MYEVNGSRAIITGSAQGFGKEFAKRLLENGCKVCLTDINEVKGLETKDQFQKEFKLDDNGICFIKCDIAAKEAWSHLWDYAEEKLRGPVDILINNAGLHPKHGWEANLEVMLMGAVRGVFTAIERMGQTNGGHGGRIINVASAAGITDIGLGDINCSGYQVAKHGLVAMTRSFLISEPKVYDTEKIKCYALCPTFADTNLVRSWKTKGMKTEYAFIASLMRILTIEDVGDAMMASLKYDKNGALYAIFPDCPLIEWPHDENFRFNSIVMANVLLGKYLCNGLFTWKHYYGLLSIFLFLLLFLISYCFHSIF